MKNFMSLLKREFRLFFSNKTLLLVFIGAPIAYALIIGSVYKSGKTVDLPIIIVDRDNTPMSHQMIEMLDENEGLKVIKVLAESNDVQSEMIVHKSPAVIVIPDRFEASMLQVRYPEVMIYCNTTNMLTANFATKAIQTSLGTFAAGIEIKGLQKRGMSAEQAITKYEPFKQNFVKVFNETGNYFNFMWPAILTVVLQQVILLVTALSIAQEVQNNTFGIGVAKQTSSAIATVLAKVIPVWLMSIPTIGIYYLFHVWFNAPVPAEIFNFAVISALFVAAVSFFGIMISALVPDALKATQYLMLMSAPGFMIGGYTWPLEAMSIPVQFLASILPLTPFLEAFKALLFEHATLRQVQPEINHLLIQIAVYFLAAILLVKWRIKREQKKLAQVK